MLKKLFKIIGVLLVLGFVIPQDLKMPVEGATASDYNAKSFWYYPWGTSVTHKGVDIFAKIGTSIFSSTKGLVLSTGTIGKGGNYVLVLGPKWRLHYYAHLKTVTTTGLNYVDANTIIGTVGASGNAKGKAPHLHYSIVTLVPYLWRMDTDRQGWKKSFYLNPIPYL